MAYVVPTLQSVLFTGFNNAEVEALITDVGYELVDSDETQIKWLMLGESDPVYRTVHAGQWLLYAITNGVGYSPIRSLDSADYESMYREIS